jgi:hypothetical protein
MTQQQSEPFSPTRLKLFSRAQARLAHDSAERERNRRERRRAAQGRYRQRLADKGIPEMRDLAEAMLAAYVRTIDIDADDETLALTGEFLLLMRDAGFDIEAVKRRVKELRRRATC